jgi:hypothetical protein
MNMILAALARG